MPTLSDKAEDLLDDLAPYSRDDPYVQALIGAVSNELDRIETYAAELQKRLHPQLADDEYGTLPMWERLMGLPVAPADVSLQTRQEIVQAAFKRRRAGAGSGWVALIDAVVGSTNWTHVENTPADYSVLIDVPLDAGDYRAGLLRDMIQRITPAHLAITITFATGDVFRVGISQVGDTI